MICTNSPVAAPAEAPVSNSGARGLICLAWAHFLNDGAAFYLPGILPAVLVALHQPLAMVGVITAALYIGQVFQPVAGMMADHIGGRSFVVFGLATCTGAAALIGLAPNVWTLLVLLLISGWGSAVFHPQALAAVRSLTERRHGGGLAVFLVGGEFGRGIWPLLTSLIVTRLGLAWLWLIVIPTLLSLPLITRLTPRLPPRSSTTEKIHWRAHRRPFFILVGFSAFRALVAFGTIVFIPIMWKLRGGALVSGAALISTLLIAGVIGQIGGGTAADRLGRRHVLIASAVLVVIFEPLLVISHGWLLWLLAALMGVAMFSTFSATLLIGQDIFPENRALGSGLALGFSNALGVTALLPLGWVLHRLGIEAVFAVLTLGAVMMLILTLGFSRKVHPAME